MTRRVSPDSLSAAVGAATGAWYPPIMKADLTTVWVSPLGAEGEVSQQLLWLALPVCPLLKLSKLAGPAPLAAEPVGAR